MSTTVSIRIPEDLAARVRARAEVEDRSFSAVVRRSLQATLTDDLADVRIGEGDTSRFEVSR